MNVDGSEQNVKYDLLGWMWAALIVLGYGWIGRTQTAMHHIITREETLSQSEIEQSTLIQTLHRAKNCLSIIQVVFLTTDLSALRLSMPFVECEVVIENNCWRWRCLQVSCHVTLPHTECHTISAGNTSHCYILLSGVSITNFGIPTTHNIPENEQSHDVKFNDVNSTGERWINQTDRRRGPVRHRRSSPSGPHILI